ncbi:MAG: ATP-binding cassette domain-containing protein, partial [Peptostreptococcaceae bacterium]
DFIMNLPQGYETIYGENNILLSGGQKQRISIARAIIKNSPIIVLDEAMTGLDNRTQNLIKENLKSYLKGKTIIIVTHKIINIKEADKIIVMKDGKVIEEGTHETLMKTRGLYYELGKETNQVNVACDKGFHDAYI